LVSGSRIWAVTDDKTIIVDKATVKAIGLTDDDVGKIADDVYKEVLRRQKVYRGDRPEIDCQGKKVLIVDDGLATGYTMLAAVRSVKNKGAAIVSVAVPVQPAAPAG